MNRKTNAPSLTPKGKLIIGLIFIPTIIYWLTTSGQPIIDNYSFRQAQTAISAEYLFENGVHFFNYETPVLGKPWAIPFEFPTYQALVKIISTATNQSLTQTGRIINSVSILLSALIGILILTRNQVKQLYVIIFSLLLATSQTYLYYGRSFLIDGTALLVTLIAAFLYIELRINWNGNSEHITSKNQGFSLIKILIFSIFLNLGMLTKATTTLPLLAFIAIDQIYVAGSLLIARKQFFNAIKSGILFGSISLLTVFLTKAWVNHADHLKELNLNANFIASKNLTQWNYGSLNDRLDLERWSLIMSNAGTKELNFGLLLPLIILITFLLANILTTVQKNQTNQNSTYVCNFSFFMYSAGPLIFFNLYFIHEYYAIANLVFGYLSLAASLNTISTFLESKNMYKLMFMASIFMASLICVTQLNTFYVRYWAPSHITSSKALKIANYVKKHSYSYDRLLTIGCDDWSSQLFYLSGLKGLAVRNLSPENEKSLKNEIQKMIDDRSDSLFIIENTKNAGTDPLSFLSKSSKKSCNFLHSVGTYNAYQCNLDQLQIPSNTKNK